MWIINFNTVRQSKIVLKNEQSRRESLAASIKSAAEKPILRFTAWNVHTRLMNNVAAHKLFCRYLHSHTSVWWMSKDRASSFAKITKTPLPQISKFMVTMFNVKNMTSTIVCIIYCCLCILEKCVHWYWFNTKILVCK